MSDACTDPSEALVGAPRCLGLFRSKFPKAKPHEGKRILYNLNRFREDLGRLSKGEGEVRRPTAAFSIMS